MADHDAHDRHLPASAKKIERSRAKGSYRVRAICRTLRRWGGGGALIWFAGPRLLGATLDLMRHGLRFDGHQLAAADFMQSRLLEPTLAFAGVAGPLCLARPLVAVAGHLGAGGWNWTLKPLAPKFLPPQPPVWRACSARMAWGWRSRHAAGLVLGLVGAYVLRQRLASYVSIMAVPLPSALAYAAEQLVGASRWWCWPWRCLPWWTCPAAPALAAPRLRMSRERGQAGIERGGR